MIVQYSISLTVTMVASSETHFAIVDNEAVDNNHLKNSVKCKQNSERTMEVQEKYQPTLMQKAYSTTCDLVSETAEYLASYSLGQTILRMTDRALWTVEKSAEWSIPTQPQNKHQNQNGTFGKPGPLIRPLSWLLFLPLLLCLRCVRMSLNIAALLLGFESVKPISMVRFIQVRRRKVRALKFLGLRRIRQRKMSREHAAKNPMTLKERFYNIMSRAMCFRVTNSDMYEEITVKQTEEEPQSSVTANRNTTRQRSVTGRDLKRKYIEILKNNYYDWEDVEDDEELIDRITQLAEDDLEEEDADFVLAEDSATEEDSISEAEDDAAISAVTPPPSQTPPKQLQRLSSHSSLANAVITEENEDSESSTVSANSDDESSQNIEKKDTPKKSEQNSSKDDKNNLEPSITSDEYYSPLNSICASPELKMSELSNGNNQNQNKTEITTTDEKNESINSDKQVTVKTKNSQNSLPALPITAESNHDTHENSEKPTTNSNSTFSPRLKKYKKHKRRFSNLLRRKRK